MVRGYTLFSVVIDTRPLRIPSLVTKVEPSLSTVAHARRHSAVQKITNDQRNEQRQML